MRNGTRCPKCIAADEGPRPVYKYNPFLFSAASRILARSRCEKEDAPPEKAV